MCENTTQNYFCCCCRTDHRCLIKIKASAARLQWDCADATLHQQQHAGNQSECSGLIPNASRQCCSLPPPPPPTAVRPVLAAVNNQSTSERLPTPSVICSFGGSARPRRGGWGESIQGGAELCWTLVSTRTAFISHRGASVELVSYGEWTAFCTALF